MSVGWNRNFLSDIYKQNNFQLVHSENDTRYRNKFCFMIEYVVDLDITVDYFIPIITALILIISSLAAVMKYYNEKIEIFTKKY